MGHSANPEERLKSVLMASETPRTLDAWRSYVLDGPGSCMLPGGPDNVKLKPSCSEEREYTGFNSQISKAYAAEEGSREGLSATTF